MKKLFLGLAAIMLVGAGCLNLPSLGQGRDISGNWYLAFNLPSGWIMTREYEVENQGKIDQNVDRTQNTIILQSTDHPAYIDSGAPVEDIATDAVKDNFSKITVTRLDERRLIPSEAKDIGHGLFQLTNCDDGGDCQTNGLSNNEYYFQGTDAKYKMVIQYAGGDNYEADAEKAIKSVQEVTVHTDQPADQVSADTSPAATN